MGVLSRHLCDYNYKHWHAAKRVLRYLHGTMNFGIHLGSESNRDLLVFSDADFAGDVETRKSTSGTVVLFNGGPVSWKSKRQSIVTLLTMEAEYVSLSSAVQETCWILNLLNEINYPRPNVLVHEDNKAAISLLNDPVYHQRSKHIDVKYHYVKSIVKDKNIKVIYCETSNMIADALTKPLSPHKFTALITAMNILPCL